MQLDLKAANNKLKDRSRNRHQNVALVPKELHELKRATHKLQSKVEQLKQEVAELRGGKKVKGGPAKKEQARASEPEVSRLVVPRKPSKQ